MLATSNIYQRALGWLKPYSSSPLLKPRPNLSKYHSDSNCVNEKRPRSKFKSAKMAKAMQGSRAHYCWSAAASNGSTQQKIFLDFNCFSNAKFLAIITSVWRWCLYSAYEQFVIDTIVPKIYQIVKSIIDKTNYPIEIVKRHLVIFFQIPNFLPIIGD
jgi:hypothetical protein